MSDEKTKMSDEELENVVGGNTNYSPGDALLKALGLSDCVETNFSLFAKDQYYNTKRGNDWKEVGSEDMLNYVGRTKGWASEQYNALKCYCDTGECDYQGQHYSDKRGWYYPHIS